MMIGVPLVINPLLLVRAAALYTSAESTFSEEIFKVGSIVSVSGKPYLALLYLV